MKISNRVKGVAYAGLTAVGNLAYREIISCLNDYVTPGKVYTGSVKEKVWYEG